MSDPTLPEYAQFADQVYSRTAANQTPIPSGWTELSGYETENHFSGFSSGVFQRDDDIVISYTGANEDKIRDFAAANVPAGLGFPSQQVTEAMSLYLHVKEDHPDAHTC
jgi:hypothetical protein